MQHTLADCLPVTKLAGSTLSDVQCAAAHTSHAGELNTRSSDQCSSRLEWMLTPPHLRLLTKQVAREALQGGLQVRLHKLHRALACGVQSAVLSPHMI